MLDLLNEREPRTEREAFRVLERTIRAPVRPGLADYTEYNARKSARAEKLARDRRSNRGRNWDR